MKNFDVQGIELKVPAAQAIAFIADPKQLPRWTHAFASVDDGRAVLRTPAGQVEIGLEVLSSIEAGTIDWRMTFPDGSLALAYSRVVGLDRESCAFTFVLTPPPVPLEQLEGALLAQSKTLAEELLALKGILENHG